MINIKMGIIRYSNIETRKEWKSITSKNPPEKVEDIWKNSEHLLKPCQIKFLATLVEYDPDCNFEEKFNRYNQMGHSFFKANTEENYIFRYGKDEGVRRYKEKNKSCINTLDNLVAKYGKEKGELKYKNLIEKRKNPKKTMMEKYGYKEGIKRYKHFCERNKGNHSLDRKIELYGEEEGIKRYNQFIEGARKRSTLGGCIELYGEEMGRQKYYDKRRKLEYGASVDGFKEKYGDTYKEEMRKSKDNTSLESYINRYGENEGLVKYAERVDRHKFAMSLEGFVERHGEELGNLKYLKHKKDTTINFYSKVSQDFFDSIHKSGRCDYATSGGEFLIIDSGNCYFYDFVHRDLKKVIEFNGDCFHANPNIYKEHDKPNPFTEETSKKIWEFDKRKIDAIVNRGYDVMIVWESDYREDPEGCVKKANEFIYDR